MLPSFLGIIINGYLIEINSLQILLIVTILNSADVNIAVIEKYWAMLLEFLNGNSFLGLIILNIRRCIIGA